MKRSKRLTAKRELLLARIYTYIKHIPAVGDLENNGKATARRLLANRWLDLASWKG